MRQPYHLRRTDREITDREEILSILKRGRFATFALSDPDGPYVVTLSYGLDASANTLYFHVAHVGRKMDIITTDPRACGTVVIDGGYNQGECEHPFESVVMEGSFRVLMEAGEKLRAITALIEHLEDDPAAFVGSRPYTLDDRIAGFTALAFDIDSMSAKRGK